MVKMLTADPDQTYLDVWLSASIIQIQYNRHICSSIFIHFALHFSLSRNQTRQSSWQLTHSIISIFILTILKPLLQLWWIKSTAGHKAEPLVKHSEHLSSISLSWWVLSTAEALLLTCRRNGKQELNALPTKNIHSISLSSHLATPPCPFLLPCNFIFC